MSSSSDRPGDGQSEAGLPRLTIGGAHDLFGALRSDSAGVRLSVLTAISKAPDKAVSYGPYNGRDLLQELFEQLNSAADRNYRLALLGAITAFDDLRVKEVLEVTFRMTRDAREAAVCAAKLCCGPDSEVRRFFLPFLRDGVNPCQARLAADVLARFHDHSPEDRVMVAVLSNEAFPVPGLDDATEAVWMKALQGPLCHRTMGLLESLGSDSFVRLRRRWDGFTPEVKAWLLGWGCRQHQAHAVELCLKALEEGPDETRLAALRGIGEMGPGAAMFRPVVTRFFDHPDPGMRIAALRAGAEVADVRGALSEVKDMELRLLLIPLLPGSYGPGAVDDLVTLLHDESWRIRNAAVTTLISLGNAAAEKVVELADHDSVTVRAAAVQVIRGLEGPA